MMKRIVLLLITCFGVLISNANPGYDVRSIPEAMLKNAHVVKRQETMVLEIINSGEAVLRKKYALTILDESAADAAAFTETYDKIQQIRNIEGALYNAAGIELKRLKNKQIFDLTAGGDELADDNRVKFHHFRYNVYPYTVEYEVEIRYNGMFFLPSWFPREYQDLSVEQSSVTVISPEDYEVRYKTFNCDNKPATVIDKGKRSLTWEVKSIPAYRREYLSPSGLEQNTAILFAPTAFEIERYKGDMSNWQGFGKFIATLKQGRDELPPVIKQKVHEIADPLSDKKQKVTALYKYMQNNTRYISIQLGIGGWQPFPATYVAQKSYGDCKALVNYMYSLLKEAGITSYYTLVRSGRNATPIIRDFPSQQFNHVILCVPVDRDTTWLECTSQTTPAGYLGDFTGDRDVLLVDENASKLIHTPAYSKDQNIQVRELKGKVTTEGELQLNVDTRYGCLQQEHLHQVINNLSRDKVKEMLHEQLDFPTYTVNNFSYRETPGTMPAIEEKLEIAVSNYATLSGKRLFLIPNIMNRGGRKLPLEETRKTDIVINYPYRDEDAAEIILPEGYTTESIPKSIELKTKFGYYNTSIKLEGNKLIYKRIMEQYNGRFLPSDYPEWASFLDAVYKSDRSKLVLVKSGD